MSRRARGFAGRQGRGMVGCGLLRLRACGGVRCCGPACWPMLLASRLRLIPAWCLRVFLPLGLCCSKKRSLGMWSLTADPTPACITSSPHSCLVHTQECHRVETARLPCLHDPCRRLQQGTAGTGGGLGRLPRLLRRVAEGWPSSSVARCPAARRSSCVPVFACLPSSLTSESPSLPHKKVMRNESSDSCDPVFYSLHVLYSKILPVNTQESGLQKSPKS